MGEDEGVRMSPVLYIVHTKSSQPIHAINIHTPAIAQSIFTHSSFNQRIIGVVKSVHECEQLEYNKLKF